MKTQIAIRLACQLAGEIRGPRLMSERNLTWTDTQPINNTVVSGQWWAGDTDRAEVSLEKDYADDFQIYR